MAKNVEDYEYELSEKLQPVDIEDNMIYSETNSSLRKAQKNIYWLIRKMI